MGQASVRLHILQENEVMGPLTQVECLMGTNWAFAWKHPSFDRREVPPLHGWVLLVVPFQILLARSKFFSCHSKVGPGYWEQLRVLVGVTLSKRLMSGPGWQERWQMNPDELRVDRVLERYCRPRAVDTHLAIATKDLMFYLKSLQLAADAVSRLGFESKSR